MNSVCNPSPELLFPFSSAFSSLAATWRKTLTMLISSRNGQEGPALRTLGDALMTSGSQHVAAAHMCYLLAEELPRAIAPVRALHMSKTR